MRRFFTSPLLAIALLFIPAIITAILYSGLPETIPVHFNAEGIADKFGAKSSIWVHVSILFVVGLGVYLLLSNLHKIDPKKSAGISVETHKAIAIIVVLFISLISTGIVLSMSKTFGNFGIQKIVLPAVGLLIAVMGYFMRSIKPNYFIGLRLPWTLEDEENWAATHQLAAKLWIPAGLLMAVSAIAFPFMTAFFITMAITLIIVIIPAIYSYRFFKNKKA
jgi:uncharacterized membrane protein